MGGSGYVNGLLRPELYVGVLSAVTSDEVRITLSDAGAPSGSHFLGRRYGKGEVGEFVLIEAQAGLLLGRTTETRLPESERRTLDPEGAGATRGLDAVGAIQLLGSVAMDSLRVTAGVGFYPRLGDRVYAAPHDFIADLAILMEPEIDTSDGVFLRLGNIGIAESAVLVRPEKLFGRHCAILGATGGGKSWTTARIIEECLNHKAKVVLLDATGEYRGFSGQHVAHTHLGNPVERNCDSKPCALPPTCFTESDFVALFEPAGKVQGPKMRAAIQSLRLAALDPTVATDGLIVKLEQPKLSIETARAKPGIEAKLDNPEQEFDVKKLALQIEQECVWPTGYGGDSSKWGGATQEFANCVSLVTRISAVLHSSSFACTFGSNLGDSSITEEIEDFLGNDKRLLRICLSGVAHEFKAREVVANTIGRHLLGMARSGRFGSSPFVIIVDEAHNFLGRQIGNEDAAARLDAFELIAKEGRKHGLSICLTTQRPRDITEGVLSQMGTLVVHRLTNNRDREVVERACGAIDGSTMSFLPNMKPGEAVIVGADFPIPLTLQVYPPSEQPKSDGPDFRKHWRLDSGEP